MAKILIVEDDEFFRSAVADLLKKKGHEVLEAPHGRAAVGILTLQDFDAVISDIQMPGMNGIELLEWSIKNKPVPFIIMTGFSTILETQSAYDLGAKEFISKPFKNADLMVVLNKALGISDQLEVVNSANDFCKIAIGEFVAGKKVEFDVYVKLSNVKFVKIAHLGEDLPRERIVHYKEKGVEHLYIAKGDFSKLVGFNLNLAKIVQGNKSISHEKKVNFLKYTGETIVAQAFIAGVDKELFNGAQSFVSMTMNAITESNECLDLLSMLSSHSDFVYSHSVGVAIYSHLIAKKMGFESNQAFFKLSMAALFHDIGKKEIPVEILNKPRSLLTVDDKKLIDSHVSRGQEIILSISGVHEDVAQLVYEHHEDSAGLGYPMGTDKKVQHPLSKILQLANKFVEIALVGANSPGMEAAKAVAQMENTISGRYDEKAMLALKSVIK